MQPYIDKSGLKKQASHPTHRIKNDKIHNVNDSEFTLKKIRQSLSPAVYQNPNYRGILIFALNVALFVAVNIALWQVQVWYLVLPLVILDGLLIASLFIIGHDSAHSALFQSERLNWWIGQIAMLPSLHSYNQWVFGHNRIHHGHTVKLKGDFVWEPVSVADYQSYGLFKKLMHRIYWSSFGAGIYYMIEIWLKGMMIYTANQRGALRDKLIVIAFMLLTGGLAFYYGAGGATGNGLDVVAGLLMVGKMIVIPFLIWNYTMGFTIYVHHISPEIPWKDSQEWSPTYGQLFGTINYHINPLFNLVFHNIFIHMPHHVEMRIPYYNLPRALEEIKAQYGKYVIERSSLFRDYYRSTQKCKLFDVASGEWLTYKEARLQAA